MWLDNGIGKTQLQVIGQVVGSDKRFRDLPTQPIMERGMQGCQVQAASQNMTYHPHCLGLVPNPGLGFVQFGHIMPDPLPDTCGPEFSQPALCHTP